MRPTLARSGAAMALAVAAWAANAPAAPAEARGVELRLRAGRLDPLDAPPSPGATRADATGGHFVVQLDPATGRPAAALLREAGLEPLGYLPRSAFVVRLGPGQAARLRGRRGVRWVGAVRPEWKLAPELARPPDDARQVTIDLFADGDLDRAAREVAALGAEVLDRAAFVDTRRLTVRATRGQLERAAALEDVAWIDRAPTIATRNDDSAWVVQTNLPGSTVLWDRGLHGEGQVLGHIDDPLDADSCYFADPSGSAPGPGHRKLVAYRAYGGSYLAHGTHTAGTLAGDPWPYTGTREDAGGAWAARISHTDIGGIQGIGGGASNLYGFLVAAHQDGARVHSNSWGDDFNTAYTPLTRDVDVFAHEHEDSLVVFAVSNSLAVKTPENAKNVLAVAASKNGAQADSFCSGGYGPTDDGRRKPEITAPGCNVASASDQSSCGTTLLTGTSMAAPAVAAAAALARQYFLQGWYPSGAARAEDARSPSAALIRAVLVDAAVDMTSLAGYPGPREGWGRLLLDNGLYFAGDARGLLVLADVPNAAGLAEGSVAEATFEVTHPNQPLELTLVYADPPAMPMAAVATVNDLDLEVVSPQGAVYRGNAFDTAAGESIAGGAADPLNTVERVAIARPATGEWSVAVRAGSVNVGRQGFALVATGAVAAGRVARLAFAGLAVDDGAGNGNGIADPGERVTLRVALENLEDPAAAGVAARVRTGRFDLAAPLGPTAAYPDLPGGAVAESLAPHFAVEIAAGAACGETLAFALDASHALGRDASAFELTLGVPVGGSAPPACAPFVCPAGPVPGAVEATFAVERQGAADLRFAWPAVEGAAGYRLWRSADARFEGAEPLAVAAGTEWVEPGGLAPGASWYYRVRAMNDCEQEGP